MEVDRSARVVCSILSRLICFRIGMLSCPRRLALVALALAAVAIWSAEALPHSIGEAAAAEAQLKTAQRPAAMGRYHNLFHRRSVRVGTGKCEFNSFAAFANDEGRGAKEGKEGRGAAGGRGETG